MTTFCPLQHNTMESLLERGEKLDDLVSKSEHLGNQSKAFYKTVNMADSPATLNWIHAAATVSVVVFATFAGTETELLL